jgi:hypothetical protein
MIADPSLMKKLEIKAEVNDRRDYPCVVFLMMDSEGIRTARSYKGYAFSAHSLKPVVSTLDTFPDDAKYRKSGHVIAFKRIAPNWYIFCEET